MQRGFQVQVEKMNWDDVGGLEDVKRVSDHRFVFRKRDSPVLFNNYRDLNKLLNGHYYIKIHSKD
jgi:SpoVK/Ycf46/Vps4 family AAA+-type ATPase